MKKLNPIYAVFTFIVLYIIAMSLALIYVNVPLFLIMMVYGVFILRKFSTFKTNKNGSQEA